MIPTFQELMLPALEICNASAPESVSNRIFFDDLADKFGLTDEERKELLAGGRQSRFENRVYWALVYLRRAGLVESAGRGMNKITQRGQDILREKPSKIDIKLLSKFPEFREFRKSASAPKKSDASNQVDEIASPAERIDAAYVELKETLAGELLLKLRVVRAFRFEEIVVELLVAMKYGGSFKEAAEVTQKTADEGIDGVIKQDRLGLDVVYIQAKRWKQNVGRPEIQNFVGALAGKKATKGVFITTSDFNDNALQYAAGLHQKVVLIDGRRLAELMIEHGIGVAPVQTYDVKKIDIDYFEEA
ncbi:MAG: restriction endonuclease [Chthoniobacterales bacterium]|nr:restriction endonuclease [Chthoniobacterales bacterium]